MAPIKFEENIKDKLENRTIQPSSDAWNKLSTDLDSNDKKNKRGFFFYIGIAASIIGVLLVTNMMFNASENQLAEPIIVETTPEDIENNLESKDVNQAVEKDVIVKISEDNREEKEIKNNTSSIKNEPKLATVYNQSSNKEVENKVKKTIEDQFVIVNEEQQVAILNSVNTKKEQSVSALTFEEVKAIEVVNLIEKLEIENGTVTDAEIENLLKQAERDILRERIYNETTRTVDADALLQDVEDDLEKSFRTRVFEGLKSRSKTLLSAVTERNN